MSYTDTNRSRKKKSLIQSGWVVLFIVLCGAVYMQAAQRKEAVVASLDRQIAFLEQEKDSLIQEKDDLLLQINSQSDPAWIQLTLMKGLGLVPEGQLKVYFSGDGESK